MKCIECGHELKDGAIFCIRCGAMQVSMDGKPIERDIAPAQAAASGQNPVRPSVSGQHTRDFNTGPQRNGGRIAAIVAVLIVVIALIAFLAYSFLGPAASGVEDSSSTAESSEVSESSESASSASSSAASSSASSASASSASSAASSGSASSAAASDAAAGDQGAGAGQQAQQGTGGGAPAAQEPQRTVVYEQPQQAQPQPQPQPTQQVGTQTSNAPTPSVGDGYVLPESSTRYYSRAELEGMSTSDLYYARNEIFARHGRMFLRSDLQSYFDSKSWYTRTYTPDQWNNLPNQLNDYEVKNTALMKQVEAGKGSPYL